MKRRQPPASKGRNKRAEEEMDHRVQPHPESWFRMYDEQPVLVEERFTEDEGKAEAAGFHLMVDYWSHPTQAWLVGVENLYEVYAFRSRGGHWQLHQTSLDEPLAAASRPNEGADEVAPVAPLRVAVAEGTWDGGLRTFDDVLAVLASHRLT